MALPILAGLASPYALGVITVLITGAGFALYQVRMTVESVEEVFTNENSALKDVAFNAIIGAIAVAGMWYFIKGKF